MTDYTAEFEEFWAVYPRKRKKLPAFKKWQLKKLGEKKNMIVADAEHRTKYDAQWKKGYVPDPLTYLNQERWEDEIERAELHKPSKAGSSTYSEPTPPAQACFWQAVVNRQIMHALLQKKGAHPDKLRAVVKYGRRVAEQLRGIYGPCERPARPAMDGDQRQDCQDILDGAEMHMLKML